MVDQRETKDWLKAMARHMGLSLSQLAVNSGMAASTVTRFVNDESNVTSITQSKLEQVARYTGFRPHQMPGLGRPGFAEPDAVPFDKDDGDHPEWIRAAVAAARQGKNGVDAWVMKGGALDGIGILPGDVVIIDLNMRPKANDVVVAQVVDYSTGSAETVMRVYQPPFVVAHSMRLGPIRPEQVDEERVSIAGTRVGLLRARH
jgi:transcriptional regulator with XRE-family HTH domain